MSDTEIRVKRFRAGDRFAFVSIHLPGGSVQRAGSTDYRDGIRIDVLRDDPDSAADAEDRLRQEAIRKALNFLNDARDRLGLHRA